MEPVTCSARALLTVIPIRPGRVPWLSRAKRSMICAPASAAPASAAPASAARVRGRAGPSWLASVFPSWSTRASFRRDHGGRRAVGEA